MDSKDKGGNIHLPFVGGHYSLGATLIESSLGEVGVINYSSMDNTSLHITMYYIL